MDIIALDLGALKVDVVNENNPEANSSWRYEDIAGNAFKTTEEIKIAINGRDGVLYDKNEILIMAKSFTYNFSKTTYIKQLLIEEPNLGITQETSSNVDISLDSGTEKDISSITWAVEHGDITSGTSRLSFTLDNQNNQNGTLELKAYVDDVETSSQTINYLSNENSKQNNYFDIVSTVHAGSTVKITGESSKDITLLSPIYFSITKTSGV